MTETPAKPTLVQELRELRDTTTDENVKRLARKALNRIQQMDTRIKTVALLAEVVLDKAKARLDED